MKGRHYTKVLWNRVVPVKKSQFISLLNSGKKYNIEVDLGAIEAFSAEKKSFSDNELLYSDQQQGTILNNLHIMGSGRSGFYQGAYLKGIGRTPLAGNWNSEELYHSSGHLIPSAAIRESVVTHYLQAKGHENTIVQNKGILLKPLNAKLKDFPMKAFPNIKSKMNYPAPIDFKFQAITYKEDNFARASNIVWYLNQMGTLTGFHSPFPMHDFVQMFSFYLDPKRFMKNGVPDQRALEKLDFSDVASLYAGMLNRTLSNFLQHFQAGVYWGSFNNNYSLDGRFLDLEVPTFLGGPFLGNKRLTTPKKNDNQIFSGESFTSHFFRIMADLSLFTEYFCARFKFLIDHQCFSHAIEQEYAEAFLAELKKEIKKQAPWIYSSSSRIHWVDNLLKKSLRLNSVNLYSEKVLKTYKTLTLPKFKMNRVTSLLSPAEAHIEIDLYVADFFEARFNRENLQEFEFINSYLDKLMKKTDLDDLLFHLQNTRSDIDRFFKNSSPKLKT
jgi:hypothetical protein